LPRSVMVEYKACTGCRTCEMICSLKNEGVIAPSLSRIRVYCYPPGLDIPTVCVQCLKAACVDACPQNAIMKDEELGIVIIDEKLCTGCGLCVEACPAKAIAIHPTRKVAFKCQLCMGEAPCVEACPANALSLYTVPFDTRIFAKSPERTAEELRKHILTEEA